MEHSSRLRESTSGGDVVIVVPSGENEQLEPVDVNDHIDHHVCIDTEIDIEPSSPKTITESSSMYNY